MKKACRINLEAAPRALLRCILDDGAFKLNDLTLLLQLLRDAITRGPLIGSIWAGKNAMAVYDQYWRRTMNLFTPNRRHACGSSVQIPLRWHRMTNYWRKRGIGPDAMYKLAGSKNVSPRRRQRYEDSQPLPKLRNSGHAS